MKKKSFFITFEGCEGSGKSTHAKLASEYLKKKGFKTVLTREPGGTTLSENIRKILLDPSNEISPLAELLLYEACRAQHMRDIIIPAIKNKKVVICDRFTDATIAYQGFGRGLDVNMLKEINLIASSNIEPDLTIVFDYPVEKGLKKAKKAGTSMKFKSGDRIEMEELSFHKKVRQGYLFQAKKEPKRVKVVKTAPSIEETKKQVVKILDALIK